MSNITSKGSKKRTVQERLRALESQIEILQTVVARMYTDHTQIKKVLFEATKDEEE